ncbi:hypothetical protein [Candidatus Uabimicrobium sp. HlEnr_7]|uniref:hypothetical protein n=1 Tax=Candidatus Uabimicrobium helgolandensis TaxID=3095367 RepID=UPI0035588E5B
MSQIFNVKCDNCQSNIEISISPANSLIHLTCLKCRAVIFDNHKINAQFKKPKIKPISDNALKIYTNTTAVSFIG